MGNMIDRVGTFRGYPVSSGMGASSGGFPQFLAKLEAAEYWDAENEEWMDWTQYEEREITAYLVLMGKEGKPFKHCGQLMKALGWSGRTFAELNDTDYSEVPIQFRVEENTYKDNTRLQVAWVDHADAVPGRTVEKLDATGVKKLDAQFAKGLKALGGGPVISKPSSKPAPAPKAAAKAKTTGPKGKGKKKATATAPPPAAPPTAEPEAAPDTAVATAGETCTKNEAWEAVCNGVPETVGDEQIQETWLATTRPTKMV